MRIACAGLAVVVTLLAACRDEVPGKPARPPAAAPSVTDSPAVPALEVAWNLSAGPALIVSAGAPDTADIILPTFVTGEYPRDDEPDLAQLSHSRFDLFGRSGRLGSASLTSVVVGSNSGGCSEWPRGHIAGSRAGWDVGLVAGKATAVPLDSLTGISSSDSAAFLSEVVRAAMPVAGKADSVFSGIPFEVRAVYRFAVGDTRAFAASLQRSIPSEANPREEQTFVIAERQAGDSAYRVAFTRRASGAGEAVRVTDVLAVVVLRADQRPLMMVSDEHDEVRAVALLERVSAGHWREAWKSAYVGC